MQLNRLTVNDLNKVRHNLRRTYLVRAPDGLFWIVLSRVARGRVRAGVFVVERRQPSGRRADGQSQQSPATTPGLAYRVTTATGKAKSRGRPRRIGSSSSLSDDNRGDGGKGGGGGCASDAYAIIRSRERSVEFHWWLDPPSVRRDVASHCAAQPTTSYDRRPADPADSDGP